MDAPDSSDQVLQLKQQLHAKENELATIKTAEDKVLKRLKTARKNVTKLEAALKDMPSGVMVPLTWVHEFSLNRVVNIESLQERLLASEDARTMDSKKLGMDTEDMEVTGTLAMQAKKKEFALELKRHMRQKTPHWLDTFLKAGWSYRMFPPVHQVSGQQFCSWLAKKSELPVIKWSKLWNYPNPFYWVWVSPVPDHEASIHNRCLKCIELDIPNSSVVIEMLSQLNVALSIRLRPWDGICLDYFVQPLLALPWAMKCLQDLFDKGVVSIWHSGHIPAEVLKNQRYYSSEDVFQTLIPFWKSSKVWSCEHRSHGGTSKETPTAMPDDEDESDAEHVCPEMPKLPATVDSWLIARF
ncbi:hypothetical protein R1sor_007741 [Riccia sorocarpa]|uniref:Uncharacterized protein n=1 Tax=Riccia sorocarpa TaxID=122646 RepID=A0ABD3HUY7_9MARC